jgi:hypothetical protein
MKRAFPVKKSAKAGLFQIKGNSVSEIIVTSPLSTTDSYLYRTVFFEKLIVDQLFKKFSVL